MHGESGDYLTWLRSLLSEVERAMEAEGIDAGVRERVVNRVVHGEPERPDDEPADFRQSSVNVSGL